MKVKFLILSLFIPAFMAFPVNDSITIIQKVKERYSLSENFINMAYTNPAIKYYKQSYSITELALTGEYDTKNDALLLQDGTGFRRFSFYADSYLKLKKNTRVWGKAYYKNNHKEQVQWNESSDFSLVYPYVMADTLGGDLSSEEYFFAGGYAKEYDRFSWGAYADYRALLEYRQIDPRPKNVVADLQATLGASIKTGDKYTIGISVHAQKYKQTNEVKFFSELGAIKIYHLTGLGMDYTRFSGDKTNTYYKGHTFGAGINLYPHDHSGFIVSINYDRFSFTKIISDLNELPFSDLAENKVEGELAYMHKHNKELWGIKGKFLYKRRKGTENIFGDPQNDEYPKIAETEQYGNYIKDFGLAGVYENKKHTIFHWAFMPLITYNGIKTFYVYPERSLVIKRLNADLASKITALFGKHLIDLSVNIAYSANLKAQLLLSDMNGDNSIQDMLYHNYRYLSSDHIDLNIGLRWNYRLPKNRSFSVGGNIQNGWYTENTKSRYYNLALGFLF
ncbi:MAG: hypothetical protein PUB21_08370 [Bacteroidales bacterium]|nr:hypothetical protein [Bacteroidales bacterium]